MDALLEKVGVQALNYAVRSGIAITSVLRSSNALVFSRLWMTKRFRTELAALQHLLNTKIRV